jgi:hypothetical protein
MDITPTVAEKLMTMHNGFNKIKSRLEKDQARIVVIDAADDAAMTETRRAYYNELKRMTSDPDKIADYDAKLADDAVLLAEQKTAYANEKALLNSGITVHKNNINSFNTSIQNDDTWTTAEKTALASDTVTVTGG